MGELFLAEDAQRLLHNKFVVVFGDSIQRGVYRDLICLLQKNVYLTPADLKGKGEHSFMGDELLEGGCKGERHNGKHYREVRQYQSDFHLIRYYYVTHAYCEYLEDVIEELTEEPIPDVIIMNSCIWDLTRYGARGRFDYPDNLQRLFHQLKHSLPPTTLFLWLTALPLAPEVRGGVFLPELTFFGDTMRYDVVEANFAAHLIAKDMEIDVLDLHYNFVRQQHLRGWDGIHWNFQAHRRMSNLILTHICEAWHQPLPRSWAQLALNSLTGLPAKMYQNNQQQIIPLNRGAMQQSRGGRHLRSISCDDSTIATRSVANQITPKEMMMRMNPQFNHNAPANAPAFHEDVTVPDGNGFFEISNLLNNAAANVAVSNMLDTASEFPSQFQSYQNGPLTGRAPFHQMSRQHGHPQQQQQHGNNPPNPAQWQSASF